MQLCAKAGKQKMRRLGAGCLAQWSRMEASDHCVMRKTEAVGRKMLSAVVVDACA